MNIVNISWLAVPLSLTLHQGSHSDNRNDFRSFNDLSALLNNRKFYWHVWIIR